MSQEITPAMLATMTPDQILAFVTRLQSEKAVAEAEAKLAKSKNKAKEFNPNTCEIYVKPGGKTINIKLGKGVGKYGVLTLFPEGLTRLVQVIRTGRIEQFANDNAALLNEMHAAFLAAGLPPEETPAEEPATEETPAASA